MGKSLQLNCTRAKVLYINPCMAGVVRKLMPIAVTGGVVLLGWGLMKALSPSKEAMMKVGCSSWGLNTPNQCCPL